MMKVYVLTAGNGKTDERYDVLGAYPTREDGLKALELAEGWVPRANLRLTEAHDVMPSPAPDQKPMERSKRRFHRVRRLKDTQWAPACGYDIALCGNLYSYGPFAGGGSWYDAEGGSGTSANMIEFYESNAIGEYAVEEQIASFPKEDPK